MRPRDLAPCYTLTRAQGEGEPDDLLKEAAMNTYPLDPACPVCRHPDRQLIDEELLRMSLAAVPLGTWGAITTRFPDLVTTAVVHHERFHRNPPTPTHPAVGIR